MNFVIDIPSFVYGFGIGSGWVIFLIFGLVYYMSTGKDKNKKENIKK